LFLANKFVVTIIFWMIIREWPLKRGCGYLNITTGSHLTVKNKHERPAYQLWIQGNLSVSVPVIWFVYLLAAEQAL